MKVFKEEYIKVGDIVHMFKCAEELEPMYVGSKYIVNSINNDIIGLFSEEYKRTYFVSEKVCREHFEKCN